MIYRQDFTLPAELIEQVQEQGLPWQRCQFHLQQNAQAYVPRQDLQAEVAVDIRVIFDAPDRTTQKPIWPKP